MSLRKPTVAELAKMAKQTLADGREVGYKVFSVCEHEGCKKRITRALSHCCGESPMKPAPGCGHHFCLDHLSFLDEKSHIRLCPACKGNPS